jgi:hypothetical protein
MAMADASDVKRDRFAVVRAWHEAVNQGDVDALVALSDDDIEVGGPRGSVSRQDESEVGSRRSEVGGRKSESRPEPSAMA